MNLLKNFLGQFLPYSPRQFWHRTSAKFLKDPWQQRIFPQHRWLKSHIDRLRPRTVLEVGCGFGRNLNFLQSAGTRFFGVDLNLKFLQLIRDIPVVQADAAHLPFADSAVDLTFTHGLLMHVPRRHLHQAVSELIRATRRHLILIEEVRPRPGRINYFTFAHDYRQILREFPVKIISFTTDSLQLCRILIKL